MSKPRKIQRKQSPPPAEPHQMSIAFESNRLRGLPAAERMKVLTDLAYLLMPAIKNSAAFSPFAIPTMDSIAAPKSGTIS